MSIVFLLVGVGVVLAVALVATGRGGELRPVVPDRLEPALPDGPVRPGDVADLRFAVAFRGYRMDQVDAVLDRLGAELAERDARLGELEARSRRADETPGSAPAAGSDQRRSG